MTYSQLYALRKRAGLLNNQINRIPDEARKMYDNGVQYVRQNVRQIADALPEQVKQYIRDGRDQMNKYYNDGKKLLQPAVNYLNDDAAVAHDERLKDKARSVIQAIKSKLGLAQ